MIIASHKLIAPIIMVNYIFEKKQIWIKVETDIQYGNTKGYISLLQQFHFREEF